MSLPIAWRIFLDAGMYTVYSVPSPVMWS